MFLSYFQPLVRALKSDTDRGQWSGAAFTDLWLLIDPVCSFSSWSQSSFFQFCIIALKCIVSGAHLIGRCCSSSSASARPTHWSFLFDGSWSDRSICDPVSSKDWYTDQSVRDQYQLIITRGGCSEQVHPGALWEPPVCVAYSRDVSTSAVSASQPSVFPVTGPVQLIWISTADHGLFHDELFDCRSMNESWGQIIHKSICMLTHMWTVHFTQILSWVFLYFLSNTVTT